MRSRWMRLTTLVAALSLLLAGQEVPVVHAGTTIMVDTTNGGGPAADGDCSLHEAILNANDDASTQADCPAGTGADTIVFDNALGMTSIVLTQALPAITDTDRLTIDGGGDITVDGNNAVNIFYITGIATLQDLIVFQGYSPTAGGGVSVSGILNVLQTTFEANSTGISDTILHGGGAIYMGQSALVEIERSTFRANSSGAQGGAIYNFRGTLNIANSTFVSNSATGSLFENYGGAIFSYSGGVVQNPFVYIHDSTFSENSADAGAGAAVDVQNGGLYFYNTILANSLAGDDCVVGGSVYGEGVNDLIEDASPACGLTNGVNGNIVGSDPGLAASLSGPAPFYFKLNSDSPAIDAGNNGHVLPSSTTDQPGNPRFRDNPLVADTGVGTPPIVDIGAYEYAIPSAAFRSQGTYDGYILESTETSGAGGSMDSTAGTFIVGDDAANKQYRSVLSFNTAGLPDAATIVSAKLTLRLYGVSGFNPFFTLSKIWIDIKTPAFGSSPMLELADFNAATSMNNVGSIANKGAAGYYSSQLSSGAFPHINKTGLTQLRLRFWIDDDNDNIADYLRFFSGNHSLVSARPVLVIEYMP